jgi:hypothetical protein
MPLNAGDLKATEGLARDIFLVLDGQLRPRLESSLEDPDEQLPPIQEAWRTLSFCIASGVIEHIMRFPPPDPVAPGSPEFAEAFSSETQDSAYWSWFGGFASVFRTWASSAGGAPALRTALNTFFAANPTTPTRLRGILR